MKRKHTACAVVALLAIGFLAFPCWGAREPSFGEKLDAFLEDSPQKENASLGYTKTEKKNTNKTDGKGNLEPKKPDKDAERIKKLLEFDMSKELAELFSLPPEIQAVVDNGTDPGIGAILNPTPVGNAYLEARQRFQAMQEAGLAPGDAELFQQALANSPESQQVIAAAIPYTKIGKNGLGDFVCWDRNGNEIYREMYARGDPHERKPGFYYTTYDGGNNFSWSANYNSMRRGYNSVHDIHPVNRNALHRNLSTRKMTEGCFSVGGERNSVAWQNFRNLLLYNQQLAKQNGTAWGFMLFNQPSYPSVSMRH